MSAYHQELVERKLAPPESSRSYKRVIAQSWALKKLDRPPTRAGVATGQGFERLLSRVLCA
jgi:hypothetical protein